MLQGSPSPSDPAPGPVPLVRVHRGVALALLGTSVACWLFVAWLAVDMDTPIAQLAMPTSRAWTAANLAAVWTMWCVMMVAMMLPSALPMVLTFVQVARRNGERGRAQAFVAAYGLVWLGFATAGTLAQWLLQRSGLVDPMAVSRSTGLTVLLLLLAGAYQFSPLKRVCLRSCRTPLGFLLGHWRPGVRGAFSMGLRHGMLCLGCCWALMGLLFIGGMMNVPWVAALAIAVAIEKLAPGGERVAILLGVGLIAAATVKLIASGI